MSISNELSSTFGILTPSRKHIRRIRLFKGNVEKEGLCSCPYFRESSSPLRYLSCDEQLISLRGSGLNKSGKVSLSIVRSVGATLRLQHLPSGSKDDGSCGYRKRKGGITRRATRISLFLERVKIYTEREGAIRIRVCYSFQSVGGHEKLEQTPVI